MAKGQRYNLTGNRYGSLVVLGRNIVDTWNCQCDCGRTSTPRGHRLLNGITKSCGGCRWKEVALRAIWSEYKVGARRRGLAWELTEEQFKTLIYSPCYYTGKLPTNIRTLRGDTCVYNGIDRLDSTKGYTIENCVPCCSDVNYAKQDLSYTEFLAMCREVTEHTCQKTKS